MKTLVLGASGATGKLLVSQLHALNTKVKVLVRPTSNIPEAWETQSHIEIIRTELHELNLEKMAEHLQDCDAVASCLGHNLTWKGIYGKPRRLVRDAVKLACDAIIYNKPKTRKKFILMNTTGNRNRDLNEAIGIGNRIVIALLRLLLPPHPDNEQAAEHLRLSIGQNHDHIEWVAVRPDGLIDLQEVSEYNLHPSPIRNPIFNAGITARINVAHFMSRLISDKAIWDKWKGKMPVIYNAD